MQVALFVADADFDPKLVKRSSKSAAALCRWVRAMDLYHKAKQVSSRVGSSTTAVGSPTTAVAAEGGCLLFPHTHAYLSRPPSQIVDPKKLAMAEAAEELTQQEERLKQAQVGVGGQS